jgi:predicted extracellular nuclease
VISINDVAALEGDSGTTTFTFGIGLSQPAGAGGVTFDIATANGTATAGSDYVAGATILTIPAGNSSITFAVSVNGDTTPEADETFFVNITNVTGANVADGQGQGTIQNDDVAIVQIHDIQGNGLTSPINGATVTTEGIVTALKFNNGFFLQTADAQVDADPNTSQGIFVFTSTAPPASAAVGNRVRVTGTVAEFIPTSNPNQLSITQLTGPTIVVLSTGNPLPTPVTLSSADFNAASVPGTAEKFEGMRATVASAVVVAGSDGNITESSATSSTTGVFHVALDGVARPFREPGIGVMDVFPIPGGKTPPRFDTNQERIMIRSRGQVGATSLALDVGAQISNMTGVLDYFAGTWALLPDIGSGTATGGRTPTPVADARPEDVTISAANLLRFFDEINDANGGPTLTAAALDKRLTKTSLAICDFLKAPDILGVVEVENLRVLGLLADRINGTCARAPQYVPYLVQGNDVGGINVGFLVNTRSVGAVARVEVLEVTQFGAATVLNNPDGSTSLLNDRPPLLLRANVHSANGASWPVTVIVNHMRSLNGLDDTAPGSNGWPTEGDRVRNKRGQQAMFLANLVHTRQVANPAERIVLIGDFNAFEFNDGYVDVMGIVRGDEAAEPNVISYFDSPITRPLIDGSELILNPLERYSYEFDGNAQTLDHVVINEPIVMEAADIRVDHARINADFGVHNFGVAGNAIRVSDHDPVRIAISVAAFRSADLGVIASAAPASVRVGGTANYTVDVDNAGPNDAAPASLALVFDAVVTPAVTAPAGWTCAAPVQTASTTTVTCTTATFAVGATDSFAIAVVTDSALANRALTLQAAIASTTADPANANNQATAAVNVLAESDLGVTASGSGGVDVGGNAGFTVGVSNAGPDAAAFTGLALVFDAVVSPAVTAPAGWTCAAPVQTASTTTVTCTIASFASGGSGSFTVSVPVGAALGGQSLTLAAAITSQYTDPNAANNTATASVAVRAIVDLGVTVAPGPSPVTPGGTASYTVAVANGGPSAAASPSLSLVFDALVVPTVAAPGGWTCAAPTQTASTTTVTCTAASLAAAANASFPVSFPATNALAGRLVQLTATIASATADTAAGNDTASAAVQIRLAADLAVTVTAAAATAPVGSTVVYNATVANNGPNAAASVTITFDFDALVTPTIAGLPAPWTCSTTSQTATLTRVVCSGIGAGLGVGGSAPVTASFPADAALNGRTVRLTASIAAPAFDPVPGNNQASAQTLIQSSADLSVRLIGRSGRAGVFMVAVRNDGPSAAANPSLVISGNLLPRNVSIVPAAGWTCAPATVATGFRFNCSASGPLANGGEAFFGLAVAGRGPQAVTITATVSSTTPDSDPADNTAQRVLVGAGLPDECTHRFCRR